MARRPTTSRAAAVAIGLGGIALITLLCVTLARHVSPTIPALLLLVPVAITSVIADRVVAIAVAVVAALVYALAFIPPIGAMRIDVTEDVFVLITFVVVAVIVGALKGPGQRDPEPMLDDQRAVLLRGVSHDLRNPLTTIKAISTDLRSGAEHDEETRNEMLERVVDESERLDRIVGNLLSVSRVQAGTLAPARAPESPAHLVDASVNRLQRSATQKILVDVDPDLPDVDVDAVQFDQVLTNLVENALRFSPPDGTVTVSARQVGAMVEFAVADSGPGFSAEARAHLFEPHPTAASRSAGLGLTVCKAIVEAHGGTIRAGDQPTGGARVAFTVPIEAAADPGGGG